MPHSQPKAVTHSRRQGSRRTRTLGLRPSRSRSRSRSLSCSPGPTEACHRSLPPRLPLTLASVAPQAAMDAGAEFLVAPCLVPEVRVTA